MSDQMSNGFPRKCCWYGDKKQGPGRLPRWFMTMYEEQISKAGSEQCPSQMAQRNKKSNQSAESATNGSASKSISVRNKKT